MAGTASPDPGGDYTFALSELHRLLLNFQSADSFLRRAAGLAARTVGSGLSCSIMLQPGGHSLAVATSDPLATLTEQLQESTGQGPGLRCLRWQQLVHIDDLAEDTRWPVFARRATELAGVASCLCLPLKTPSATGALSLYAPVPHAFGAPQISRASTFAGYLASAVVIGARQDGLLASIGQLRAALASRAVIDQAIGVIMTRDRCSSTQAAAMLRAESQHHHLKLGDLARQVVTDVSGGPSQRPPREAGPHAVRAHRRRAATAPDGAGHSGRLRAH